MPVREIHDVSNLVMDVYLKNNESFKCCDVPPEFLGKHEKLLSFWLGDCLNAYPLEQVEFFVIREMKEEEKLARQ